MPEQLSIGQALRVEDLVLTTALDLKAVDDLQRLVLQTRVGDVRLDHVGSLVTAIKISDITLELEELGVEGIDNRGSLLFLDHQVVIRLTLFDRFHGNRDLEQVLNQI